MTYVIKIFLIAMLILAVPTSIFSATSKNEKERLKQKKIKKIKKVKRVKKTKKQRKVKKQKKLNKIKKPAKPENRWHYLLGWGNEATTVGVAYTTKLSDGGFWRLESGFNTVVGDATLGAENNSYSLNALLSMNATFFSRLTLSIKGGPSLRHSGFGLDASTKYYNYGASLSLDLDKRGSYGIVFYADVVGITYRSKF